MKALKRNKCSILPLVLKNRWYDLIEQGVKDEEYRTSKKIVRMIQRWWGEAKIEKKCAVVEFRRDYSADAPRMTWIVTGVYFRQAGCYINPEMGEPTNAPHYALVLGERIDAKWNELTKGDNK